MNTKDLNSIPEKYPNLYKRPVNFECYSGWYKLINDLSKKLNKLCKENDDCYPTQIKEKYGTLRFYMSSGTEEMYDLIEKAEDASEKICEICGEPGRLMSKFRWLFTRCELHKDV